MTYTTNHKTLQVETLTLKGTTNDGTTFPLTIKDSDDATIETVNTEGFKQLRWRDEYVASDYVQATGSTPPDDVTVTIGGIVTRLKAFDGGTTIEWMANSFEMPHDADYTKLNAGTVALEFHVHSLPSSNAAGRVDWILEYSYLPTGAVAIACAPMTIPVTYSSNTLGKHYLSGADFPIPAGGFKLGDVIIFNIKRTPATDTFPDDALFIKCAMHVPLDDFGSRQIYIK